MKKKVIVAMILIAVAVLAAVTGWGIWRYLQPNFHDVTVELGTKNVSVDHFLRLNGRQAYASFVTDLQEVNWDAVGTTEIALQYGFKQETVKLHIQDTIAPKVEFHKNLTKAIGFVPKPEDFIKQAEDFSDLRYAFKENYVQPENYEDVKLTVVVTDGAGNATEQKCTLSFSWMHAQVTLELGQQLTLADVLMNPEDAHLIDQAELDKINAGGVGVYIISSVSGENTRTCTVTVKDTTAPQAVLKPGKTYQGDSLQAQSFVESAEDISGELTVEFVKEPDWNALGAQTVKIQVSDASGNKTTLETQLEVVADTVGPTISFKGNMVVAKNTKPDYLSGVTATDERDGACQVTCDASKVDMTAAGTYTITYTAKDKSGNVTTKTRKVEVSPNSEDTLALVKKVAATLPDDPQSVRNFVRDITYTHTWGGDDPVWQGLTKKHGNCYVHALTLKALLEEKGYETQLIWVEGSTVGSEAAANGWNAHYWLLIKLGDGWKHIDGTPGNTHTIYDEPMNDEQRLETLKGRSWERSKWPACN